MKKLYSSLMLLSIILFSGCSKDLLKSYDTRIVGTWRITDVNRIGIPGNTERLAFNDGTFTFNEDGSLVYVSSGNVTYQGKWDIVKKVVDDETFRKLQVSVVNYSSQEILSEYYDNMTFVGTNHFKAEVATTFTNYVTHFHR